MGYREALAVYPVCRAGKEDMPMAENSFNSKTKDSSSKLIFENPILCAQFLRGYLRIPLLKEVQPEDIEDVSERYVHMFTEERNSDVVKKVHIKSNGTPFFLISLIEHKAKVDYNVVMQVFRYMTFIWEDYEKEQERQHPGSSRKKEFKYPPILPVVFYDGTEDWTAAASLHERVLLSDIFKEYIPDYRCILMQLKDYSNAEAADFAGQVKERRMGELFSNFEAYDVQATRRKAREEGIQAGIEQGIERTNKLTRILLEKNRIDDLKRAAADLVYQEQMFREFHL